MDRSAYATSGCGRRRADNAARAPLGGRWPGAIVLLMRAKSKAWATRPPCFEVVGVTSRLQCAGINRTKTGASSAESEEGRLLIKENTFPPGTYPTQSGSAHVPRVGECADKLFALPPVIPDKNRMTGGKANTSE